MANLQWEHSTASQTGRSNLLAIGLWTVQTLATVLTLWHPHHFLGQNKIWSEQFDNVSIANKNPQASTSHTPSPSALSKAPCSSTSSKSEQLSISIEHCGITKLSLATLQGMWRKAESLLSTANAIQETKTFTMLGEVGMANESTKTTQTSVRMAQHNERTRLHDLLCTPTNLRTHALVMPTLCVEPSAHLFVWFLSIR